MGSADRGHDVRAAVHRPPEHQRGRHAERRQRQRGDRGAAEEQDPGEDVPDHRSGRVAVGLQNILKGYQCGTVYKPIYLEAQAAAALALYLRAGKTPPSSLVNATTKDSTTERGRPVRLHEARLGHDGQHGRHGRQGRRDHGRRTLRRQVSQRVQGGRDLVGTSSAGPGLASRGRGSTHRRLPQTGRRDDDDDAPRTAPSPSFASRASRRTSAPSRRSSTSTSRSAPAR